MRREGSLLWRKGEQRPGKERKERPRAEKFTEGCVPLAGREQGTTGEGRAWVEMLSLEKRAGDKQEGTEA